MYIPPQMPHDYIHDVHSSTYLSTCPPPPPPPPPPMITYMMYIAQHTSPNAPMITYMMYMLNIPLQKSHQKYKVANHLLYTACNV